MGEERSRTEKVNALVEKIKEASRESLIIVEGKKDEEALISLGIKGKFFFLSSQRNSLYESAENISANYKKVLLFLDLDWEGKRLSKIIKKYFSRLGVKVNLNLARNLLRLKKTQFVEGLGKTF